MNEKTQFEKEVKRLIETLEKLTPFSEEYYETAKALNELCEARSKKDKHWQTIENLTGIAVNLMIVLIIVGFERSGVLTTKVMSFVKRS